MGEISFMQSRIESLQGLRLLAFLGVFFLHAGLTPNLTGIWGVSVFFVLSGFVIAVNWLNRIKIEYTYNILDCFKFVWKRIRKLYILHIITLTVMVCLSYQGLFNIIANVFLIQSWIPSERVYYSYNGVVWYLSTSIFLYFFTIPLLHLMKKNSSFILAKRMSFFVVVGVILYSIILCFLPVEQATVKYLTYIFPIARLADYVIGMLLGVMFLMHKESRYHRKDTAKEVVCCLLILATCIGIYILPYSFKYQVLFLPTTAWMIWLCATSNGAVVRLLSTRCLSQLGDYTAIAFIIHREIIYIIRKMIGLNLVSGSDSLIVNIIVALGSLILCSFIIFLMNIIKHNEIRKVR